MKSQQQIFTFDEKITNLGFLEGVLGDLEVRLESYRAEIKMEETLEERIEMIETHIRGLSHVINWHHDLWDQYARLVKKENEKLNF